MSIIDILKKVTIFQNIPEKDLKKMESILKEQSIKKSEHIFSENDMGDKFYIVNEGRIKIYKISTEGQVKTYDYLQKGDFFGEMALLNKSPRSANAQAVQDSHLFFIRHEDFQEFVIKNPEILYTISQTLCIRLRKADLEIEMFSFKKVRDRLMLCIIYLAEKYGEPAKGNAVSINFTHQDLSELVGTAREVVSRLIKKLKDEKLLITDNQRITIPSLEALKKKIK